jgi:tetrapyrrole methylase family protein/MazG family protein
MKEFDDLVSIVHQLRRECPWDREQDLESLKPHLIEEAFEVLDAMAETIKTGNNEKLLEELGDLLLQIVFQSEIISEKSKSTSTIASVISKLRDKLIRRHPHVFGDSSVETSEEVLKQWEAIKRAESSSIGASPLDGIASGLTSLQRAVRFGKCSESYQFDWKNPNQVWAQLGLELKELEDAKSKSEKIEELGDVLFCLCQWARHEKIDPETALAQSNLKFKKRFEYMIGKADLKNLSHQEKEALWNESKNFLRKKD